MRHSANGGRVRRGFLLAVAAISLWLVAMGVAIYGNARLSAGDWKWPGTKEREAEQRRAELKARLAERARFKELELRADKDRNVSSIMEVADAYANGTSGAPKDLAVAFAWYRRAALRGNVRAILAVARAYDEGLGIGRNTREAAVWYKRAVRLNSNRAAVRLADLYFEGGDVPRDDKAAFQLYQQAADAGNAHARRRVAEMYEAGRGVKKDLATAFYGFARLAEAGDPEMQTHVGWMLAVGRGVPIDREEAARWYRRAADRDYLPAVAHLGLALLFGRGVDRDEKEGAELLRRAAEGDDSFAILQSARLYLTGAPGFEKSESRAIELLRKAAALHNQDAAADLAYLQLTGVGIEKDEVAAHAELERLAPTVPRAKEALAELCLRGASGVPPDWPRARILAREAGEDGVPYSMMLYALMLKNGIGGAAAGAAALTTLRSAAEADEPMALLFLAELVSAGDSRIGLQPDRQQGRRLLDRFVAARASAEASSRAKQLEQELASPPPPAPEPAAGRSGTADLRNGVPADTLPVPLQRVPPAYPFDLRFLGITGVVLVDFVVSDQGTVVDAFAASSTLAGFERPAIVAVSKWTFKPGTKDGQPVNVHMQVPMVFRLTDDEDAAPEK